MKRSDTPQVLTEDLGDTALTYLLYEGDGPTLILLHATGFHPWLWHPIARALSPALRVIAPYFCDHRAAEPEEGLDWALLANDLTRFVHRLGIEKPFAAGHSMGGTVLTLAHAEYGLDARGMVLIEPIFLPPEFYQMEITMEQHPLAAKAVKRRNQWPDMAEAKDYLLSRDLFKTWDPEMLDLYLNHGLKDSGAGGLELTCSPRREAALFMGGRIVDPWPLLPRVTCPVLILEGEYSENRDFIDLPKAASILPQGQHWRIPGAGHLIPMEQPAVVRDLIGFFCRSILNTPG